MKFIESVIKLSTILNCNEQNKDYLSTIKKKLDLEYGKKAFEKYGIIDEIIEIKSIHYEELMNTQPSVYFIVNTLVRTYYPKKDDIITVEIYKILSYGIYIQKESFRVLIPTLPPSYKIYKEDGNLVYKSDHKTIKTNDTICIQLTDIRYEKQGFHCLAVLCEN
jgi:DNA-directed RNA polymerase subunit E'/Rpb7